MLFFSTDPCFDGSFFFIRIVKFENFIVRFKLKKKKEKIRKKWVIE